MSTKRKPATCRRCKALAAEIAERRRVGAQMANVLFNLARTWPRGEMPSERTLAILDDLRKQWDAIKRPPSKRAKAVR